MGPFTRNTASSPAIPLTVAEFANALFKKWSPRDHAGDTLGLAVSGGVDSMALAALCSRLQDPPHQRLDSGMRQPSSELGSSNALKFRAFIVDHSLRTGSDIEAEAVSRILKERDIETQILKIRWPGPENPAHLPNFESLARKYRFHLLGKACSDSGINSLLLAHHEDDQAETIMMRLANGHGVKGLVGIRNPAGVPECYGIHGVHESGGFDSTLRGYNDQRIRTSNSTAPGPSRSELCVGNQLSIETGGIQVHRPFLEFSKVRLVATCLAENMEWFEDHTNKNPTATMRNATRHMYSSYSMPVALTKPALLALSTRLNDREGCRSEIMKSWLAKCRITRFETRTGTARVHFADLEQFRESRNVWPPADAGQIAAELLRHIIRLVTPQEHVDLKTLHRAIRYIFPELQEHEQPLPVTAFTASGVYFQPVHSPSSQSRPPLVNQKITWSISRQPHVSGTLPKLQFGVPVIKGSWSPWHLYDGRYWIRVQNRGTMSLLVQPFKKEHLSKFHSLLAKADGQQFRKLLREKAPDKVRWTLPAIVRREEDGREMVIALPSLHLSVAGLGSLVGWEIRYKKIYTDDLPIDKM